MLSQWSHATNSQAKLEEALRGDEICFVEVDILMGHLFGSEMGEGTAIPILSHPPHRTSDLSVASFLQQVLETGANGDAKASMSKFKLIKMDIKDREAVRPTLDCLYRCGPIAISTSGEERIVLNADILPGPGKRNPDAHMPTEYFMQECLDHVKKATSRQGDGSAKSPIRYQFSLGYTVDYKKPGPDGYTEQDVEAMIQVLKQFDLDAAIKPIVDITLALNARVLSQRAEAFNEFMKRDENICILAWTGTGEPAIPTSDIDTIVAALRKDGLEGRISFDCVTQA